MQRWLYRAYFREIEVFWFLPRTLILRKRRVLRNSFLERFLYVSKKAFIYSIVWIIRPSCTISMTVLWYWEVNKWKTMTSWPSDEPTYNLKVLYQWYNIISLQRENSVYSSHIEDRYKLYHIILGEFLPSQLVMFSLWYK